MWLVILGQTKYNLCEEGKKKSAFYGILPLSTNTVKIESNSLDWLGKNAFRGTWELEVLIKPRYHSDGIRGLGGLENKIIKRANRICQIMSKYSDRP